MAQTRTVCLKVFEIIVYLTCAVFFIAFFFNDQIDAYLKGQYSLANGFVKVKALEFPTITMCIKPGRKLSSSLKYNLQYYDGLYMNDFGNSTLIEVYNESSYELGRDFDIFLNSNPQNKVTLGEFHFVGYEGYEEMSNGSLDVLEVRTLALGKCYALVPHSEINQSFGINFEIRLNQALPNQDFPESVQIFLTSNKTWANVAYQMWPQINPSTQTLRFGNSFYTELNVNLVENHFIEGNDDIIKCLTNLAMKANCSVKCHILSAYDLPLCKKPEDLLCMILNVPLADQGDCYMAKKFNVYNIGKTDSAIYPKHSNQTVEFFIGMYSMIKQNREEIEVISTADLIGSVGGSLGMFFGFSFTATCSFWMKKIFEKL